MRQVGDVLNQRRADRFAQFLRAQGIKAQLRDDDHEHYSIWVYNEDDMPAADDHYRAFKIAPEAAVFDVAPPPPEPPPAKAQAPVAGRSRYIDVRTEVFGQGQMQRLRATLVLIGASVLATLLSGIPRLSGFLHSLYYSEFMGRDFPEISHGQVWRLVTPVFMHEGIMHLLFNMMWLYQLGGGIEVQEGTAYFTAFILIVAAIVNTAQYLVSGPLFLGMSGVVYALFGYVWMMSRYQAASRYNMAGNTVVIMLGWLVFCLIGPGLGLMPQVANTEHFVGLITGVVWGYLRSGYWRVWLRRQRAKKEI